MVTGLCFFTLNATLLGHSALELILAIATHTLETRAVVLSMVCTLMLDFVVCLTRAGVAQTFVDILGSGPRQGLFSRRLDSFLAMATFDKGVHGLITRLRRSVGDVRVASRSCARWMSLSTEFRLVVSGSDLSGKLVL